MSKLLEDFFEEEELAEELKVHKQTVRRWGADGIGPPFVELGYRRRIYPKEAARKWLAGRMHRPPRSRVPA